MQKIVNVLALASFAVSGAVVGSGLYVYINRSSIIDGVKSQVMEAVTGSLGGLGGAGVMGGAAGVLEGGSTLPIGTNDLSPDAPQASPSAPQALKPF